MFEVDALAEKELREAILLEFLKPGEPSAIGLLRHCARYITTLFDARAAELLERELPSSEYCKRLRTMEYNLPVYFFGCRYEPNTLGRALEDGRHRVALGCPWGRCVEYAAIALADHGPEPRPGLEEILDKFLPINGHAFVSYALQIRSDYWMCKASSTSKGNPAAGRGASDATMMAVSGHLSKRMLEHYSHVRMAAKRTAIDALGSGLMQPVTVSAPMEGKPS
ncbi:MAG: hypothetical protein EBY17_19680 [Acidobacteriia bacterium]|nr:hypothetical protein [Terriglobia bacterium]